TTPEAPKAANFNPTSIKGIKAANPGAGINLIEPPSANNKGDAGVSYPIQIPPGRGGMQPNVGVQYNGSQGNGWMGVGWDISQSSVSIDTRWGVPLYNTENETETYSIDGQQLTPMAHRGALVKRTPEKRFYPRIEGGFNKIIRHGDNPNNYWWEVTGKSGGKTYFGKIPEDADYPAVLRQNNSSPIFKWAIRQVRDPNGNTIDYFYDKVYDKGTGGGEQGVQLYLKEIRYTGTVGSPGRYSVRFIRGDLDSGRRPDISINCRSGFKMVTAQVLRRVEVYYDNTQLVRSYDFVYKSGAFYKTLLTTLVQNGADGTEFNKHEFTYYNDVEDGENYRVFNTSTNWKSNDDGFSGIMSFGGASLLGGTTGMNLGWHGYFGIGLTPQKSNSVGFKIGNSYNNSKGNLALVDIDGDGLPDKVYKSGGGFKYRPNLGRPGPDGQMRFGSDISINLPAISKSKAVTWCFGGEIHVGVGKASGNAMVNTGTTTTKDIIYFSDVNGDGLIDLVTNKKVLFNRIEAGKPTFREDSSTTSVPIGNGTVRTEGLIKNYSEDYEKKIDLFPLFDPVRRWVAPFDGDIRITGTVKLIEDSSPERAEYETADGVKVSIQQNKNTLHWSEDIAANDYSSYTPKNVENITVSKGDRIYFRVQSSPDGKTGADGAYDQVEWNPEITYLTVSSTIEDVNGLKPYRYKAGEDFVYAGRGSEVFMPLNGKITIKGNLNKKTKTTDDVQLVIFKNGALIFNETKKWNETGDISLLLEDIAVKKEDKFKFYVYVNSPIDVKQLDWQPELYYTEAEDEDGNTDMALVDELGKPIAKLNPCYDIDLYPITAAEEKVIVVSNPNPSPSPDSGSSTPASDSVNVAITPKLTVDSDANGTITLYVKHKGKTYPKTIDVVNGKMPSGTDLTFVIEDVSFGEKLSLSYVIRDTDFETKISVCEAMIGAGSNSDTVNIPLHNEVRQIGWTADKTDPLTI
ncbi:MAG: sugar-binding protein, partial [Pseudoalteromonas sp.]|nr:sugar-binding protein [Pseudoalteromonas sp.]